MDHRWRPLKAAAASLGVAAVLGGLAGCGDADGGAAAQEADPNAEAATRLNEAQMVQFGEADLLADQSETGTYAQLASVRRTEELREDTELDKPQCMDAVNQWGRLPEVREAPASVASFGGPGATITHTLIGLSEQAAVKALDAAPPEECASYEATVENGLKAPYTLRDLDLATVGEESRAFVVETEVQGEPVLLYGMVYRNGDYLGSTSVLGPDADALEDTLVEFSEAALEREEKVLGRG
ncbi:hypothetical protein HDA32_005436 [Spinactinospora alkalitolerans]|uniref:Lipoprotein n=1 Tax=Spinactinospora alkalitolerans TaxID=687207 RepID=A0A852U0G0_9ACTN|nr:hypothetical protein [Spinactinospora alkalitolerans]NYE50316.1 hypothetical protein [Spinactinospora alkalitolerans]